MHNESDKSWNNRRADLISMFKYCEKKNLLPPGALNYGAVARMKVGPGSRATCSPDELQRLLDYAEYLQDQVCVALQAQAGLRTAEVGRFRLCFVDWEELMIRLPGFYLGMRVTKTGEARDIPLVPALHTVLLRLKQKGYPEKKNPAASSGVLPIQNRTSW